MAVSVRLDSIAETFVPGTSLLGPEARDYNFCWAVRTLEYRDDDGRVRKRSPAMAAGLADHVWTMREWITMPSVQCG